MRTFAERLAWLRTVSGCRSRELGTLAELSTGYAHSVEKHGVKNPHILDVDRIAKIFGVSLLWLGLGQGPRPRVAEIKEALDKARTRAQ